MSWDRLLEHDSGAGDPLRPQIDALFAHQRATWPALRDGEAALGKLERKTLVSDGQSIIVQLNPVRRRSTLAKTDAQAVAARACFLCPENMPAEERGVAFEDLVLLPNPYPILPLHCTIACREHRPQQLAERVDALLRLAAALGPDLVALYNGPRCGASAPDHLHFQAAPADEVPILRQLPAAAGSRRIATHTSFGRNMLIFGSTSAAEVQADIERAIEALCTLEATNDEPMFNLLAQVRDGYYVAILFPRAAHRPACYFATGPEQLTVSPAILEMCGILVTTDRDHFARLDAPTARTIYREVSLPAARFEQLLAKLA